MIDGTADSCSAQPLFASATPEGLPVVFIVLADGTCVVKVGGEVRHHSDDASPAAIATALAAFGDVLRPGECPRRRSHR
jgi:hypothetical protein